MQGPLKKQAGNVGLRKSSAPRCSPRGFSYPRILNTDMPLKNSRGRCFPACYHLCLFSFLFFLCFPPSIGKWKDKKNEIDTSQTKHRGWGYSSGVKHLLSVCKVLGSIPIRGKKKSQRLSPKRNESMESKFLFARWGCRSPERWVLGQGLSAPH